MAGAQVCFNWRDSGDCKFGSNCRFFHDGQETRGSIRKATQICYTFRDQGSCEYGDDCRFSHDLTIKEEKKEVPQKRKAPRKKRNNAGPTGPVSGDRLECFQFKESGECSFGENCRFMHGNQATRGSRRKNAEVCFSLRDDGVCKWGDGCRYSHDLDAAAAGGGGGAGGGDAGKQVCWRYRDTGECQFGDECRFLHEDA